MALETFHFQYNHNKVYKQWANLLNVTPNKVNTLVHIPFLPIEFFKKFEVLSSPAHQTTFTFTSSSTTSQTPSTHYVNDVSVYEESFLAAFKLFYGKPSDFCILALLPNYLQRKGSSLVYMCERLIKESQHPFSGFFLDNISDLIQKISQLKNSSQKVLLIGVSYALMDLCDTNVSLTDNFIVMEPVG